MHFCTYFLLSPVYFYCAWCIDKHTGRVIHVITRILLHSSFCTLNFILPASERTTYRVERACRRASLSFLQCVYFLTVLSFAALTACSGWCSLFSALKLPRSVRWKKRQILKVPGEGYSTAFVWNVLRSCGLRVFKKNRTAGRIQAFKKSDIYSCQQSCLVMCSWNFKSRAGVKGWLTDMSLKPVAIQTFLTQYK